MVASGLKKDWNRIKKVHGRSTDLKAIHGAKQVDTDNDTVLPGLDSEQSRSSSCSSFRLSGDDLMGGEFDDDEGIEALAAARAVKSASTKSVATDLSQMGLNVSQKDADKAIWAETGRKQRQKPYRDLKAMELPFRDADKDPRQWDRLVRALLDWAGTLDEPFGINGRPDIPEKLQQFWDIFFEDYKITVEEHPAIRKVATDRLNEWRSQFGKIALRQLERRFKGIPYKNNIEARVQFVAERLPQKVDGKFCIPFIYADHQNMKSSWEGQLLLKTFAYHVKRVGEDFVGFSGKQVGALALSAAALWKTGENEKSTLENESEAMTTRRHVRKTEFDEGWGDITQGYLSLAQKISDNKWARIFSLVNAGSRRGSTDHTGVRAEELTDDLMEARTNILLSDSETEI
ncbi:hypothetical protein EDD15DRAFT_2369701 [Pisolithus albus]|nr:hypothetical protein EDD15DRAFT_2369701 [Pisolithus albus]